MVVSYKHFLQIIVWFYFPIPYQINTHEIDFFRLILLQKVLYGSKTNAMFRICFSVLFVFTIKILGQFT